MENYDTHFVIEQIPKGKQIIDFRSHTYENLRSLNPNDVDVATMGQVDARDFLAGLASMDSTLFTCQSRNQLIDKLNRFYSRLDMAADGSLIISDASLNCGIRDNIGQLLAMLNGSS